jgi:hypothetical protein
VTAPISLIAISVSLCASARGLFFARRGPTPVPVRFEVWVPAAISLIGLMVNAVVLIYGIGRMGGEIGIKIDLLTTQMQEMRGTLAVVQQDSVQRSLLLAKIETSVLDIQRETRFQRRWRHWAQGVFHLLALKTGAELQPVPELDE